jgi:peptidylprolyl isomerase
MWVWAMMLGAQAATWPVPSEAATATWDLRGDGLESQDLEMGTGETVVEGAEVTVHYTGRMGDGTVFDSSVERGQPFVFSVGAGQVIKGWELGLIGMKVGGTRRLKIPAALGYGDRSAGSIPPGSTLYFEIELLGVRAPRATPEAPLAVDGHGGGPKGMKVATVQKGTGRKAKKGERVCVDLAVWVDGALVDHTYDKPDCWWFRYDHSLVMPGLTLGMKGMKEGGVRQLVVPVDLVPSSSRPVPVELSPDSEVVVDVTLVQADG